MFGHVSLPMDTNDATLDEVAVEVATNEFEVKTYNTLSSDCTIVVGNITGISPFNSIILGCPDGYEEEHTCTGDPCSHCTYSDAWGCECEDFNEDGFCNHSLSCVEKEDSEG